MNLERIFENVLRESSPPEDDEKLMRFRKTFSHLENGTAVIIKRIYDPVDFPVPVNIELRKECYNRESFNLYTFILSAKLEDVDNCTVEQQNTMINNAEKMNNMYIREFDNKFGTNLRNSFGERVMTSVMGGGYYGNSYGKAKTEFYDFKDKLL